LFRHDEAASTFRRPQPRNGKLSFAAPARGCKLRVSMRRSVRLILLVLSLLAVARAVSAAIDPLYNEVTVEPTKTSIYVGSVSLKLPPFSRENGTYRTTYQAKVFPYFFHSENGTLAIHFSEEDLQRLAAGETIEFTGEAKNSDGEAREVTGRAQPFDPRSGKLKVRVRVTPKIELIFNTTYRFTG
jgi:hypothetical protein